MTCRYLAKLGVSFYLLTAFAGAMPVVEAAAEQDFLINRSNFDAGGIYRVLSVEHSRDPSFTVNCAGSWKLIWPEVEAGNPWAIEDRCSESEEISEPLSDGKGVREPPSVTRGVVP